MLFFLQKPPTNTQNVSFEIINEKISGGMFDTIRHPFFCIIYVRLTEEFKF